MRKVLSVIGILICMMLSSGPVVAADGPDYDVEVHLPENQMKKSINYWWLNVKPGTTQRLSLTIANRSNETKVFLVSANTAITNSNMTIDYSKSNKEATPFLTGKQPFLISDVSDVNGTGKNTQQMTVKAGQSKKATIKLQIPKRKFSGLVLGGINVSEVSPSHQDNQAINNVFGYSYAIVLQESKKIPDPQVKVASMRFDTQMKQFTFEAQNVTNSLAKKIQVKAVLTDSHGHKVATYEAKEATIVPQGVVKLLLKNKDEAIGKGRYKFKVTLSGQHLKNKTVTRYITVQ